jgi:hypothetical protein
MVPSKLFIVFITFILFQMIDKTIILHLKTPNDDFISLDVIDVVDREHLLKNEVDSLFKMQKEPFRSKEVFRLKNGDLLHLYTANQYALLFHSETEMDKFLNNKDYFTVSLIYDKNTKKFYSNFWLHSEKSLEMMGKVDFEIEGYPCRSPILNYKLYCLKDGSYLRAHKQNENFYEAHWFSSFEDFEWYYKNQFCD